MLHVRTDTVAAAKQRRINEFEPANIKFPEPFTSQRYCTREPPRLSHQRMGAEGRWEQRGSALPLSCLLSLSCVSRRTFSFLTACLLYSRLVLNLQKFIRYKLLLPSYSFIAPRCTESPPPLLFLSGFLFGCFYDSRLWILPTRPHRSSRPAPSACF